MALLTRYFTVTAGCMECRSRKWLDAVPPGFLESPQVHKHFGHRLAAEDGRFTVRALSSDNERLGSSKRMPRATMQDIARRAKVKCSSVFVFEEGTDRAGDAREWMT